MAFVGFEMDDRPMAIDRNQAAQDELSPEEVAMLMSNPEIAAALERDASGIGDYVDE